MNGTSSKTSSYPESVLLIPGVIDSTTNYVEHPELIAERIVRLARLVGRSNVLAGSDCGFGTGAGRGWVAPSVVWAKFRALAEGVMYSRKVLDDRTHTTVMIGNCLALASRDQTDYPVLGRRPEAVAPEGESGTLGPRL